MLLRHCLIATLSMLPLTAGAEDAPKTGTANITNTWMITSINTLKVGDHRVATNELSGITRNDSGGPMFSNVAFHCMGIFGLGPGHGACTYTDKDNDQIMVRWEETSDGAGHSTIIAGSGKFTGITGSSEWTVQFPIKGDDRYNRGIGSEKVTWKLP